MIASNNLLREKTKHPFYTYQSPFFVDVLQKLRLGGT